MLIILLTALSACLNGPATETSSFSINAKANKLDAYLSALVQLKQFNGVILAYQGDSLVLEKAYNLRRSQESSSFVSINHQFDIHSVAKLMTHYLIEKLEMQGLLHKQQNLSVFYPDFPNGERITIQMLLEHQSGLPRELMHFAGREYDLSSKAIVDSIKHQALSFEPGTDIQYSNLGYELLYDIISGIYRKPFAQCVVDEIFVPLEMQSSGAHFFTTDSNLVLVAYNHSLENDSMVQVPNILMDEFKTARFYSTAQDLMKFLRSLKRDPYCEAMKSNNDVIAKDGGSKGIRAQVYLDLQHDFSYVLCANYDEMPFFKTVEDLAKILSAEEVEIPKELNRKSIMLDENTLKSYEGQYQFADFDGLILKVVVQDKALAVYQNDKQIALLRAEKEGVFFEDPKAAESFKFIADSLGGFKVMMGWKGIEVEGLAVK